MQRTWSPIRTTICWPCPGRKAGALRRGTEQPTENSARPPSLVSGLRFLRQHAFALDKGDDRFESLPGLEVGEDERALAPHAARIAVHHVERCADQGREIDL